MIVGDGPQQPELERRIAELGLERTVVLLGHRDDVPDLIRGFDVAVCSSDFEGTPLSVLEYMQARLPIVATRVGGIPDLIEDGGRGLLVEPRDPAGLAAAVARLLGDPELAAASWRSSARERQHAEFDIDVTVRAIERIYEGLASGRTAAELGAGGVDGPRPRGRGGRRDPATASSAGPIASISQMNLFDSALMKNAESGCRSARSAARARAPPSARRRLRSKRRTARTMQASEKTMIDISRAEADDPDLRERAEIGVVGDARVVDHAVGPVGGAGLDDVVDRAGRRSCRSRRR